MATCTAQKTGVWSDPTVWNNVPGLGDTVKPASYVVTVDVDVDLGAGEIDCSGQSGYFAVTTTRTITCATIRAGTSSNGAVRFTAVAPNTLSISANIVGGSGSLAHGAYNQSTGSLIITGNVTSGSGGYAYGVVNASSGSLTIIGNVTGGSGGGAYGAYNQSTGTITITGDVRGGSGSGAYGAHNNSTGSLTITGNVTGGSTNSNAHGAHNNSTGSLIITGNVTGGSVGNVHGVYNNSQGILNITGNVSGGPGAGLNTWGAVWINGGSGTVDGNVAATIYGGGVWVQANANNLAVVTITGDVTTTDYRETDGVGAGFAGVKAEGKVRVIIKGSITDGAYGQPAVMGRFFRDAANPPLQWVDIPYWDIPTGTASYERLYHPAYIPGGLAEKDVREGVGYFGVLVGTLAVPDPGSVALGVPTDDTVGTAVLTAAAVESAVWDALRADHTTDGTYGDVDEWAGAIDSQQIRDAMKLAPSAGAPAANSIDDKIDTRAAPGDAMTLTAGERASVATTIWSYLASALTTAGSIGKALVDYITYALTKLGLISASGITTSTLIVGGIPADNTTISIYQGTDHTIAFSVYDENGDPVDLTGEDADIRFEATTPTRIVKDLDDGDITVGPAINQGTLTLTATETRNLPAPRHYEYELRVKTAAIGEQVQARGRLVVIEALITSMAGL